MRKSVIPLNNRRRLALQKQQQEEASSKRPDFQNLEQVIEYYLCLSLKQDDTVFGSFMLNSTGEPTENRSHTYHSPFSPREFSQVQFSSPALDRASNVPTTAEQGETECLSSAEIQRKCREFYPIGLSNVIPEVFHALNETADRLLSQMNKEQNSDHHETVVEEDFNSQSNESNGKRVSESMAKARLNNVQSLFRNLFKPKHVLLKSYYQGLREKLDQVKLKATRDKFIRELQIQILLSFLFLLKMHSTDQIKPNKLDMIYGLLYGCKGYYYDSPGELFDVFLRKTMLIEPLVSKFPRALIALFKKFSLPVPPELQSSANKKNNRLILMNGSNENNHLTFQEEAVGGSTPGDKKIDDDEEDAYQESNTYEELMANMKKKTDVFSRRLLLDTPSRTFRMPSSMTPMGPPPPTPDVTYTRGVNVAPTPDFGIATTGRKKKRKFMQTKKILNFSLPEGDPEPKRQKVAT